jgi:hypothetical protein
MDTGFVVLVTFLGAMLGGGITALIVDLLRQRSRNEAYLLELYGRKVDAYSAISVALRELTPNTTDVLLTVVAKHLPVIDWTVSRWLNLILFGLGQDFGFKVFLGYLKEISPERAEQLAKLEKYWPVRKNSIALALSTDAINAMRKDLRLTVIPRVTEIVSAELIEIESGAGDEVAYKKPIDLG